MTQQFTHELKILIGKAAMNHRRVPTTTLTWPNESVGDDATVFTPIESNQCQINGQNHQKDGQQYRL